MGKAWTTAVVVAIAVMGVVPNAAIATAAAEDERGEVVRRLLVASGTDAVIDSFIASVTEQMQMRASELAGGEGPFLREAFEAVFAPGPMRQRVIEHFEEHWDATHARAALDWFESPFGKKVRAEEAYAQSAEAERPMRDFVAAMESEPPNPDRVALAIGINRARASSTLSYRLLYEFMLGLSQATIATSPTEGAMPTPQEIEASVREQLGALEPVLAEQMAVFYTFMGRNLTLDENRAYLEHVESQAGQWFYPEMSHGLVEAMGRAGQAFGMHVTAHMERVRADAQAAEADDSDTDRKTTIAEARTFAAGVEAAACVDEIYGRRRACLEPSCVALVPMFADSCFEVATRSPGLCDGVPSDLESVVSIFWRADTCAERKQNNSACSATLASLQRHCAGGRASR